MGTERSRIFVTGVVQGVGFRPFIYQLATSRGLNGYVYNSSQGVTLEAEGPPEEIASFTEAIWAEAPPQARIDTLTEERLPETAGYSSFEIRESLEEPGRYVLVSPDIATCDDCLRELFDSNDRRYRYPFINCTNCGPRFTIIEDIPYDRPKTTMRAFTMCPPCQAEYDDPANRRFHAQPNACAVCGPELTFVDRRTRRAQPAQKAGAPGEPESGETPPHGEAPHGEGALVAAEEVLASGGILALKGLGGFQLACDATSEDAVARLRERKRRYGKPLAVMVKDAQTARNLCEISPEEEAALTRSERPIVLMRRRTDAVLAEGIAPRNKYLGVMLPYTPAHHLILRDVDRPLVMTSGNLSEEPIAMENDEALRRLDGIADAFLMHNRGIYSRYDDSVVRVIEGEMVMVRRARSFAPYPIRLPSKVPEIMAVGPELKNTFCLTKDDFAFVSQHVGDMENLETMEHFEHTVELYRRLFRIDPKVVAYDLHPEYLSTKYALGLSGVELVGIQHHHAHIVSAMIDRGGVDPDERVIGISFDGAGYGTDGTIWGGEFLVAGAVDFERRAHLRQIPMPGGAAAVARPYRMALGYLHEFWPERYEELAARWFARIPETERRLVAQQLEKKLNSPVTSSAGRLFDAVSSLLGIRDEVDTEGQAAIELEMTADEDETGEYRFALTLGESGSGARIGAGPDDAGSMIVVDTLPLWEDLLSDLEAGTEADTIAARFHNTVAALCAETVSRLRDETGLTRVALGGGVFQNALLLAKVLERLRRKDFEVLTHRQVPTNDGGISLGQAWVAASRLRLKDS